MKYQNFILLLLIFIVPSVKAQPKNYKLIGTIQPRHATEIEASNWSVGAETMDRDYTIYENWKEYLGPLGVKKARIQAGWAKTEFVKGKYNFAWLDVIIFDMHEQGVKPWINLSYGNPVYAKGGDTRLGASMPKTEEAITAFARWSKLIAARYKKMVDEYEIWNEGLHRKANSVEEYANLYVATAEAIRSVQPEAKLIAMAIAGIHPELADAFLAEMQKRNKLHLVDQISYHPYRKNPDEVYDEVLRLRSVVKTYANHITIRQGENGAPSEFSETKALSNYEWTELSQAKWALRRMLGDLGRDIESSYFSIVDLNYPDEINRKGLLHATENQTVDHVKPAYKAIQHLTSVFDDQVNRIEAYPYTVQKEVSLSLFAFQDKVRKEQVITLWKDGNIPSDSNNMEKMSFKFFHGNFNEPVWVDLRTGEVYEIPAKDISKNGTVFTFKNIPVYDSPVLIAEKGLLRIQPKTSIK